MGRVYMATTQGAISIAIKVIATIRFAILILHGGCDCARHLLCSQLQAGRCRSPSHACGRAGAVGTMTSGRVLQLWYRCGAGRMGSAPGRCFRYRQKPASSSPCRSRYCFLLRAGSVIRRAALGSGLRTGTWLRSLGRMKVPQHCAYGRREARAFEGCSRAPAGSFRRLAGVTPGSV